MAKQFRELRERLLRAGVAPRHIRRYEKELSDHLTDLRADEEKAGRSGGDAQDAALQRLGSVDQLAKAMLERPELRSWSARAPWAVFGAGSVMLLGGAYLAACIYLWALWRVFMPGAESPFGHGSADIYAAQNLFAQAGKYFYLGAPLLAGWAMVLVAARQRVRMIWPIVGAGLVALMGSAAGIQASRGAVPHGLAHISMNFTPGNSAGEVFGRLTYAAVVATLALAPYFLWRLREGRAYSRDVR